MSCNTRQCCSLLLVATKHQWATAISYYDWRHTHKCKQIPLGLRKRLSILRTVHECYCTYTLLYITYVTSTFVSKWIYWTIITLRTYLSMISISIDDVVISTTPNISVTPWTFFTQSLVVSISKIIVVKLSGTVSSIDQCTGIDNVTINYFK